MMDPILEDVEESTGYLERRDPGLGLISTVTGEKLLKKIVLLTYIGPGTFSSHWF